jgi:hypothetical protein
MQIPNFCVKTTFQACRQPLEAAQDPGGRQYGRQVLDLDAREKRESFPFPFRFPVRFYRINQNIRFFGDFISFFALFSFPPE